MLVALNYHLLSRRLKTPTSYRQATSSRYRTLGCLICIAIIKPTRKQIV